MHELVERVSPVHGVEIGVSGRFSEVMCNEVVK